ncbi:MAG: OmpH family outer membrane protein [Bacteroidetes bacterium]|nr:OmpH family outer membrane protein [Bacteroidota bacterium]
MRNLMKIVAVLLFIVASVTVSAQTPKFGHIDLQGLVQVMPEYKTSQDDFSAYQGEMEEVLGEMQKNYQTKLTELEQLGEDVSEIKRNAKIGELQDIQQRTQQYSQTAQGKLQQKQSELLKPVYDKAQAAIEEVAKEKGLLYVFEANSLLFKSNESIDVLSLAKTKLGIQ